MKINSVGVGGKQDKRESKGVSKVKTKEETQGVEIRNRENRENARTETKNTTMFLSMTMDKLSPHFCNIDKLIVESQNRTSEVEGN